MNRSLKLLIVLLIPFILTAKLLYISNEYFLLEGDSLSPSMTYTFEGEIISGLMDTSLKIFTDPIAYYEENNALYCKDYATLRELYDLYPRSASLNYSYEDHTEILFKNRKYMSLKHMRVAFTGGAHPNTTSRHWIVNKKTGKIMTFNDLFVPNAIERIKELTDSELKLLFQTNNLKKNLFTADYQISEDIYLTKRGVVFQYDPYEIAPYAYGAIEIFIPFKKLKGLLKI